MITQKIKLFCVACLLALSLTHSQDAQAQSRDLIYGTIMTVDGESLTGYIRWDKNEGVWYDVLDGSKDRPRISHRSGRRKYGDRDYDRDRERDRSFFGIRFRFAGNTSQSGIAFGHIQRLEPLGGNSCLLTLKNGEEIEFEGGSTDIGDDIREIIIDEVDKGDLELEWDDIDWIEFAEAPGDYECSLGTRLYGTVTTRRGEEFTGYIAWDVDESFTEDILDGYAKGRKRKIRFAKIEAIERRGSSSALVRTTDGKETLLEDTNDVDDGNRGIVVSDIGIGRVVIDWGDFDFVEFSKAPNRGADDLYDGGRPIYGTVITEDGESFTGSIIWDADERYTWEILDGNLRDIALDVFFSNIATIEKHRRGSLVTLRDGRSFYLRDSNDVDDDNKGIYVQDESGDIERIDWDYFSRVEFNSQ
ncbi:hypothetical protein JYT16_01555 [Gemmatimonas aurantiaca]|nr:hypothetical protein [Gemmatimonas aurantiaca]